MTKLDRLLKELSEVQRQLAQARAEAMTEADEQNASGSLRYAIMLGHLEAVVDDAAAKLLDLHKALFKETRDPEPPEPGEADAYCILELLDEAIRSDEERRGWERALREVLQAQRQRQTLLEQLKERLARYEEDGYCPNCGRELEYDEYIERYPAPFGFGTVPEVRREPYCPACDAPAARQVAVRRVG